MTWPCVCHCGLITSVSRLPLQAGRAGRAGRAWMPRRHRSASGGIASGHQLTCPSQHARRCVQGRAYLPAMHHHGPSPEGIVNAAQLWQRVCCAKQHSSQPLALPGTCEKGSNADVRQRPQASRHVPGQPRPPPCCQCCKDLHCPTATAPCPPLQKHNMIAKA